MTTQFRYLCRYGVSLMLAVVCLGSTSVWAASATLSTNSINISSGETGSFTISGNDDGVDQFQFRWDIPSGLSFSKGSSSNLNKFEIDYEKMRIKVETDAQGSFSATINISASSDGNFTLVNTRAEINLNPADIAVIVGGGSGGSTGDSGGTSGGTTGDTGSTGGTTGDTGGTTTGSADHTFYISSGQVDITASPDTGNGATSLPIWGYTNVSGGAGRVPGPIIEMVEGQTVTVEVVNNHNRNHNFVVQGMSLDTTAISPGSSRTYTLNATRSGVFMYSDTLANGVNQALGLLGAVIVRPSAGSNRAWANAPAADHQRLWVITDMDVPRWNNVANGGGSVNTGTYRPNYFLMNGMNGFQAMGDAATNLEGNVGDMFLVRIVNAGQFDQSLHFHSNHFRVISKDGNRYGQFVWQDTINVKAGSTAMVLYQLNQPGHYPMHVHTAQMETGNGVYLNGTAAMIIAH
ncbi:MAG: multicopper oxidase domain-containing protein [Gammaproteobacteria bacterium]|nr:multicopper oxidase domain-containing protein [Gammaproteobacteria bacterium]